MEVINKNSQPVFFKKKIRYSKLEYLLVVFVILMTARATPVTRSIYAILIPFGLASYISLKRKITISKKGQTVLLVFFTYILAYLLKYSFDFDPLFTFRFLMLILTTLLIVNILGFNFFVIYEKIVYFILPFDIAVYLLQLLFPGIIQLVIINSYKLIFGGETLIGLTKVYGSILIYTVNTSNIYGVIPGNAGFAWEHGPFSIFIVIALFFHLTSNNFKIDKKFWVYTIALITTLSTTGYAAYFVLLALILYNKKRRYSIILLPLIVAVSIVSYVNIPFLGEKVSSQFTEAEFSMNKNLNNYQITGGKRDRNISIGRFSGFLLNWLDFLNNPVIGYGGHSEDTVARKMHSPVHSTTGLGNWLAQFGSIGMLLMLISMKQSVKFMFKHFRIKGYMFFILILLIIFFAFNLIYSPLFFIIVFFQSFVNKKNSLILSS